VELLKTATIVLVSVPDESPFSATTVASVDEA